ncbi:hypothetical protein [Mucilaginibacter terrae]|uniref:Outer membrane protein beta-barrel domain-containing protein n=1 Tax=Mucilaginibacter terrae TaxID=1955052 RepID=A0ABU3H073_9SPHI|nr:hypothetical protein [Mucilaginibacter terrae]MDT3405414.1 hypothetical protein [Mucilaginibacter terrae]
MSEQLDNELRKRISEVFDNYEDTAPANEGWLLLRQKFPEKKKNRIIPMWWMSAAAVLLILAAFGLWFANQPQKTEQVAVKPVIKNTQPNSRQNSPLQGNGESSAASTNSNNQTNNVKPGDAANTITPAPIEQFAGTLNTYKKQDQVAATPYYPASNTPVNNNLLANTNVNPANPAVSALSPANNNSKNASGVTPVLISADSNSNIAQQNILAQQKTVASQQPKSVIAVQKDSASANVAQSRMAALLAKEQNKENINAKKDKTENKLDADKKILYGVYAATYFNYAEGSKTQMNTGAGFSTDIRLTKNIKLSTGIAIGRNTLSYENQPVTASIQSDAIAASNNARVEVLPASPTTQLGFNSLKVAATPSVSGYNVSLTGLDVPVNIKYEFSPQKTDAYISAGVSSGTFISENFNYRFTNNIPGAITTSAASVPDASASKSFTGFNFARTLNLSMGVGYQITKHNRLVIEPFFKYPLGGLGSQQIRFGSGGLNLQFKFQGSKK